MSFVQDVVGKNVLVFGLGLQGGGVGDAVWLHGRGAFVRVTDQKTESDLAVSLAKLPAGISRTVGRHDERDVEWADIIIKNPGVPDDHPLLVRAATLSKPVMTSIAIFVREFRDHVIGITGTRGKSTTTELVYRVMDKHAPGRVLRGGNIPGTSGLALLDLIPVSDWAVLELSSFQLHSFHDMKVSPHIAVVTNMYPDHLNRYKSMSEYTDDKKAIAAYQHGDDIVVYNQDNTGAEEIASTSQGRKVKYSSTDLPIDWPLHIPGQHNRENASAALAVSRALNIDIKHVKEAITDFHGLPFRLENRGVKNGITYINDTTATTPTAVIKAISSLQSPTVLILGGQSKGLPIDSLMATIQASPFIEKIVILGSSGFTDFLTAIKEAAGDKIIGSAQTMKEAVAWATSHAKNGWNILLSPGFASFDLFDNEFDRGKQFNDEIENLQG